MSDFIERVKTEKKDLDFKKAKLLDFIKSDNFLELDDNNKSLLVEQVEAMETYSGILHSRICLNTK